MTTDIELIREALEKANMELVAFGANRTDYVRDAIKALSRVEERTLPELPDGWVFIDMKWYPKSVFVLIAKPSEFGGTYESMGEGDTTRAAVLAAI